MSHPDLPDNLGDFCKKPQVSSTQVKKDISALKHVKFKTRDFRKRGRVLKPEARTTRRSPLVTTGPGNENSGEGTGRARGAAAF